MKRTRRFLVSLVVLSFVLAGCGGQKATQTQTQAPAAPAPAEAPKPEAWKPTKPITLYVPSSAGGGHDVTARAFAQVFQKHAGQPVNIVNEAGGAGVVAYTKVMQSPPDGYTIGQMSISLVSDQYLVEGVPYKWDSFKMISQIATDPNVLVVKKGGPFDMPLEQFIDYVKKNPGKVRIGVSGNWTNHDYVRELLEMAIGSKFQRVSIKGGAQIVMSILAGDLDAGVPYPSEIRAQMDAGQLKALGHAGTGKLDLWPDVPSFKEKGIDVELPIWRALAVSKDTPDNIVQGLADIVAKAAADPEMKESYNKATVGFNFLGPKETAEMLKQSHDKYKQIVDAAGLAKK